MLHAQTIDWEVVDSYSVEPVRVYVEDDGAAIVRLAPHEIVGDYTFDMALPTRSHPSAPPPHVARKSTDNSTTSRLKSYCPRRRASTPEQSSKHHATRPALKERHSDKPVSRSLEADSTIPRTTSPLPTADSNDTTPTATTPENGSPRSKRLSLALSFLKSHPRRSSSSSAESSSGTSDAGTSDGESEPVHAAPVARQSRSMLSSQKDKHHVSTRPAVEVPAYKKSDLKRALIFARHELMKQVETSGKNALVLEGWTVTVLRQGLRYRIQVEYTGRPAIVRYPDELPPSRVPPFLEVLDQ